MPHAEDAFESWLLSLERRFLQDLNFAELRRGVQALSSVYVERRERISRGAALDGAAKRAAFALFFAPLHFLMTRHVVRELSRAPARAPFASQVGFMQRRAILLDLGCGNGASSAAWSGEAAQPPRLTGVDLHPWALGETRSTWRHFGFQGRTVLGRLEDAALPQSGGVLAAWSVNELTEVSRKSLLSRLIDGNQRGTAVLVIEPVATSAWWNEWSHAFAQEGGRSDIWSLPGATLPASLQHLARAAGLDYREIKARSLWLGPRLR